MQAPLSEAERQLSCDQGSHADTEQQSQPSTFPAGLYQSSSSQLQLQIGQPSFPATSRHCSPSKDGLTQETADTRQQPPNDLSVSAVRPLPAQHQLHSMRSASSACALPAQRQLHSMPFASTHDVYLSQGNEQLRSHENLPHISYAASHLQLPQHRHLSHQAGSLQQMQPSHNPAVGSLNRLTPAPSQMLAPPALPPSALQADIRPSDTSHALQQLPDSTCPFAKALHHAQRQKQADQVCGSQSVSALRADSSVTAAAVNQPLLFPKCHQIATVSGAQQQNATSSQATSESCQANTASLGVTVQAASMIPPPEQHQTSTQRTDLQGWKRAKRTHKVMALTLRVMLKVLTMSQMHCGTVQQHP